MGIVLGVSKAQLQKSGVKLQKGKVYNAAFTEHLKKTAAAAAGTIKPTIAGTVAMASIPSPASGIIKTVAAADKIAPKNSTVDMLLSKIPDLPGTWDDKVKTFISDHPIATTVGVVGGAAAVAGIAYGLTKKKKKKTTKKKAAKRTTKRKAAKKKAKPRTSKRRTRKSGYGSEAAYNRKGGKKVYKTKNGQPYILLASGKARFIKKSR